MQHVNVCGLVGLGVVSLMFAFCPGPVSAQQVTVSTPLVTTGDSYFEQFGTSWGVNFKNGFFRFGGPAPGQAPFGNPTGDAGARFGVGGPDWYFFGRAAQGNRRSIVSQAPSVTLQNGVPGGFYDTSISPFVISYVPVVGGRPTIPYSSLVAPPYGFGLHGASPASAMPAAPQGNWRVQQALRQAKPTDGIGGTRAGAAPVAHDPIERDPQLAAGLARRFSEPAADTPSSAARPAPSLAEAQRMREQEQAAAGSGQDEARALFERGLTAERSGKLSVARIYYRMAQRRADDALRGQIDAQLTALGD